MGGKSVLVSKGVARVPSDARSGSAMLAALFVVMMVAVLSISYLKLSLSKNREQQGSVDAKRAFYIAEAGLSEAFAGLVGGKSGNVGSSTLPATFANGVFWVEATDEGQGRTTLMSTGLCGSGRSALSIVVEKKSEEVAALGVFAKDAMVVGNGCVIDSYDSRIGTYESQHQGLPALDDPPTGSRVGSNADITVGTAGQFRLQEQGYSSAIYGDARPGPQGSVLRGAGAIITGSTAPSMAAIDLPSIEVPSGEAKGELLSSQQSGPVSLTGDHAYHSLRVEAGGKATVVGPATLVLDELVVQEHGELEVDALQGAVKIYVCDYLKLATGSTYTSQCQEASSVSLLINASETVDRDGDGTADVPVQLASTGRFYGCIFAPEAHVDVPSALEIFGSIAAESITVKNSAKIHFDEALVDGGAESAGLPKIVAWRMVDLPDATLVSLRYDPVKVLEACGVTPLRAADAHYDVGVQPVEEILLPPNLINGLPKAKGNLGL